MKNLKNWKSVLIALAILPLLAPIVRAADADYVIFISVDGLRANLLANLMANDTQGDFANFQRLVDEGAATFNARTDYSHTVTIPNHTCMATGRPVLQPDGQAATVHHGYTDNGDPGPDDTLHNSGNPDVDYIASVFDVAHDHGLTTALYASKSKFVLFDQSYDADSGAPDMTGPDNGPDKIDTYVYLSTGTPSNASNMQASLMADLTVAPARFTFVHYRDPDSAGHASGWGSAAWNNAVRAVDDYLGEVLDLIETSATLQGRTSVIVTTDHGGNGTDHSNPVDPYAYTIPFFVWGNGVSGGTDLYALNTTTRGDPGTGRPDYNVALQPIRNGDSNNLALGLLGLPAIPGSSINAAQDLAVSQPLSPVVEVPVRATTLALFPNPANPATTIDFSLSQAGPVRLSIHDVSGRRVTTLADRQFGAGEHSVVFRDPTLATGVYLVHLEASGEATTRKLLILK